ncbi:hypothetical protein ACH5RR_001023 [Cinchona calisaya]|uniref:Uncharacterized protein n=1 Tax=Cinchona calisaya TaxID=153742 RepID=A0ABD3B3E4_9GENT
MASYEETRIELEGESDADQVKRPYNVFDDGYGGFLGGYLVESGSSSLTSSSSLAHCEKDVEDCYVAIIKIRVPTFEEGIDPDKANKWFGQFEEILALLKIPKPLKPQLITSFPEGKGSA